MKSIDEIFNYINNGGEITETQSVEIIKNIPLEDILTLAQRLRQAVNGNEFDSCSIMNARSGLCPEDCKWCSQSKFSKSQVDIYPLVSIQEAIEAAKYNADKGISRFSLVTSGRTMTQGQMAQCSILFQEIKKKVDIKLCASLGLLDQNQMQQLKDVGVTRYHCNLETAPSYFGKLCTTHSIEDKIRTIKYAQNLGMDVCSGGIIGMGETMEQRLELALTLQKIEVNSIPINILNPIKGTALENTKPLSDDEILLTVAMFRIINPRAQIRLAGGRGSILHLMPKLLQCGISGMIMGDMLTTVGSKIDQDKELVTSAGFNI